MCEPIIIRRDEHGLLAWRADQAGTVGGQLFENPEQLADWCHSIAELSEAIRRITGKNSRQPSLRRASERLFKVVNAPQRNAPPDDNPFLNPNRGRGIQTTGAQGRTDSARHFSKNECHAALLVPWLQKTVERAIPSRLRTLDREGAAMKSHSWTKRDRQILRQRYPHERTIDLARAMGLSASQVYNQAYLLGLKKSAAFYASDKAGRIQRGRRDPRMVATQFRPGHKTWNKGKKGWQAGGRAKETQFKKDRPASAARNYRAIGSRRISKDGYLERKMHDRRDVAPTRRWTAVHRLVWEAHNGPIPDNHIVVFKPGQFTNTEADITVERLECISRAEHMQRHTYHNYPKGIAQLIQLRGALNRQINKRADQDEE